MRTTAILVFAYAASSWAGEADYFPLQVGNQWVLESISPTRELLNIEVLRSRTMDGEIYFLVSGYAPGERWLRMDADGSLFVLNEASGEEEVLAQVAAGSAGYRTSVGGCDQWAQPASQTDWLRGPSFDIEDSLAIQYSPEACRDVGISREVYAPDIGLVRRSIVTIRGEITLDLVYARVDGSAVLGKSKEIVLIDDFNHGSKGWLPGFSDYNLRTGDLRMRAEQRSLPEEVSETGSAYYVQSMNRSDDLFMFLKKHLAVEDGLEPNQAYRVWFDVRFSSNAPTGCAGVGGSPGDSVYLKAGGSVDEPVASVTGNGDIRLLADKGQQSTGGRDAGVVGTIANGTACEG